MADEAHEVGTHSQHVNVVLQIGYMRNACNKLAKQEGPEMREMGFYLLTNIATINNSCSGQYPVPASEG